MTYRVGIGIALVLFAVGSLAYVFMHGGEAALHGAPAHGGGMLGTEMTVYFFNTDVRCATCLQLEAYAYEAVTTQFAEDYDAGRIGWLKLDLDRPENTHFAEDFGLYTKSVVLVAHDAAGVPVRWKNLDRIWDLVDDKDAYLAYLDSSIRAFRSEAP